MRRHLLESRDVHFNWTNWRVVYVLANYKNTYLIWSWRDIFTRYVHKDAMGERIREL